MLKDILDFIKSAHGSSQTRLVVLVTAALTVIGVTIFAAQPWGGSDTAQAEDPPRICDFFPDYFLCATNTPTQTWTPSNTPTITNTPTHTNTPTNTLTPTNTPTFIPKLTSTGPPKAIIGGGTGGATHVSGTRYVPMFDTGLAEPADRSDVQQAVPSDGTVTHFFVRLSGTNDALSTAGFTLYRNAISSADNPACGIDPGQTSCSDRSRCLEFSAGDLIDVAFGGPNFVTPRAMSWTAVFTPNATCPPLNP